MVVDRLGNTISAGDVVLVGGVLRTVSATDSLVVTGPGGVHHIKPAECIKVDRSGARPVYASRRCEGVTGYTLPTSAALFEGWNATGPALGANTGTTGIIEVEESRDYRVECWFSRGSLAATNTNVVIELRKNGSALSPSVTANGRSGGANIFEGAFGFTRRLALSAGDELAIWILGASAVDMAATYAEFAVEAIR